jgi:hypothetical protein
MATEPDPRRRKTSSEITRLALIAAVGIFILSFTTMVALAVQGTGNENTATVADVCKWLVALTATAIVGLLGRGCR